MLGILLTINTFWCRFYSQQHSPLSIYSLLAWGVWCKNCPVAHRWYTGSGTRTVFARYTGSRWAGFECQVVRHVWPLGLVYMDYAAV